MPAEWSCESCGRPTRDKPGECPECGASLCQVCWHTNPDACHDHTAQPVEEVEEDGGDWREEALTDSERNPGINGAGGGLW